MMRRDWKKQLKRVRDIADKNFARGEKPEQLDESLTKLENRIDNIKQVCQAVGKKLLACLQLHGVDSEKRSKKLPDSVLSKQLQESSYVFEDGDAFRKTLSLCSKAEEQLANHKISYENDIEKYVLEPLQLLIEREIPAIVKSRKLVLKQAQEVEALKSRHASITRQSMQPQEGARKLAQAQEDVEEAVNKLELYKDQLATEMYNFYAKEADLNRIFITLIEAQLRYHVEASAAIKSVLPDMKIVAEDCVQQPVFGIALEEHLKQTKQPIASVLNECVTALLSDGMQLEGLFRVAGGTTKLKKLRAAFDAGMVDMDEYMMDPHCVASVLKLYLRELPEPLMTFELYNDWAEAAQLSGEQRINAIASTLKKMRRPHFDNLKFLVQFLSRLANFSEVNKMSPSNLAIVVGPNLLWSQAGDGQNILATGVQSAIAETMITNAALFFGEDPYDAKTKPESLASVSQNSSSRMPSVANNNSCGEQFSRAENGVSMRALRSEISEASIQSNTAVKLRSKGMASSSAARRFQAQKDFLCRRVDSVVVRSWPERPLVRNWQEANPDQNFGTAIHESFRTSRPRPETNVYSFPRYGRSANSNARDFRKISQVETPRQTPPKGVHSEMYSTAFALHSLGNVDCADYLAKVRRLWDSHMEVSRKRVSTSDMSKSCHSDQVLNVTSRRQLSLSEGHDNLSRSVLSQLNATCSDPEFGTVPSDTASSMTPSSTSSRDVLKHPMRKVESSDSLSSDSLGAESVATATNASSISSSDFSTTRSLEADGSGLIPPKRTGKKTHAPLPPSSELTGTLTPANAAGGRTMPPTSGEHVETGASNKTKATAAADHVEPSGPQILLHATKANVTTVQPKTSVEAKTIRTEETETHEEKMDEINTDRGQKEDVVEDKTTRKSTQFAANQALVSNVLSSGARKLLLTRPNTTYMDQAKVELMKTAEEQHEGESTLKSEANDSAFVSNEKDPNNHLKETTGKVARLQSTDATASDTLAAKDVHKSTEQQEETKDAVIQKSDEEQLKKKPERPTKPVRPTPTEGESGGNVSKPDGGLKAASEEHGNASKTEERGTSLQQQSNHEPAAGASPKSSSKSRSQEAPVSGNLPSGGGTGARPPKPPPPALPGSRLPSSSNDENTYL